MHTLIPTMLLAMSLSLPGTDFPVTKVLVPAYGLLIGGQTFFEADLTAFSPTSCRYLNGGLDGSTVGTIGPVTGVVRLAGGPSTSGRILFVESSCAKNVSWGLDLRSAPVGSTDRGTNSLVQLPVISEPDRPTDALQILGMPIGLLDELFVTTDVYRRRLRVYDFSGRGDGVVRVTFYIDASGYDAVIQQSELKLDQHDGDDESYPRYGQLTISVPCIGVSHCQEFPTRFEIVPLTPELKAWAFVTSTNNKTQQVTISSPR